jgi:hypothetical protein
MSQVFSNFSATNLSSVLLVGETTLTVTPSEGGRFNPLTGFYDYELVVLSDGVNYEIVKVTNRVDDTFTVERGLEGTVPREWPTLTTSVLGLITKDTMQGFVQKEEINPAFTLASYRLFR